MRVAIYEPIRDPTVQHRVSHCLCALVAAELTGPVIGTLPGSALPDYKRLVQEGSVAQVRRQGGQWREPIMLNHKWLVRCCSTGQSAGVSPGPNACAN